MSKLTDLEEQVRRNAARIAGNAELIQGLERRAAQLELDVAGLEEKVALHMEDKKGHH